MVSSEAVAEMNRRNAMLMMGFGVVAAAAGFPKAQAHPASPDAPAGRVPAPAAPPGFAATGGLLFHDEFDGPAGSAPDPAI